MHAAASTPPVVGAMLRPVYLARVRYMPAVSWPESMRVEDAAGGVIVGQVVEHAGVAAMWLDGLDAKLPALLPLPPDWRARAAQPVSRYFEANAELVIEVTELATRWWGAEPSPTLVARAVEFAALGAQADLALERAHAMSLAIAQMEMAASGRLSLLDSVATWKR